MPYTYSTFAALKTSLSTRLTDLTKTFWTDIELGIYINAALREWNSISRMFRDRGSFATSSSSTYYDLTSVLLNGVGTAFLSPVVTDAQLLTQAKYMLIEPNPSDSTSFTDGFTLAAFNESFARRRNQFLLETGLVISQPTAQVVTAGDGRVTIADDSVIDVRRATWTTVEGVTTTLFREDEFTAFAFNSSWPQNVGTPRRYSVYPDPLLTIQLIPPPSDSGTLSLQTISSGTVLDDFTPSILWGVLADVLNNSGPANEPLRAKYGKARWDEGVIVGRQVATILQSFINGVPVPTESVFDFDTLRPSWMTAGVPRAVGLLGSNLVAVAPTANGSYGVMMDAVRNAPQLVNDTDPLTIGREYLDLILDYCIHLASFKQGGAEFQATLPLFDSFFKAAVAYNNRVNAQNLNFETMIDKAQQQEQQLNLRRDAA